MLTKLLREKIVILAAIDWAWFKVCTNTI